MGLAASGLIGPGRARAAPFDVPPGGAAPDDAPPRETYAFGQEVPSGTAESAQPVEPDQSMSAAFGAPDWIRVPRIDLNSATVDVGVVDGYYDVPWFDVGHHADSANPGEPGNSIFNGHVLTIDAGHVFYHLNALAVGDALFVYTPAYRTGWSVTSTFTVPDGDNTFLEQTDQPRVTLYTCTGTFNFLERSYAERLVVVCQLEEVVPRT